MVTWATAKTRLQWVLHFRSGNLIHVIGLLARDGPGLGASPGIQTDAVDQFVAREANGYKADGFSRHGVLCRSFMSMRERCRRDPDLTWISWWRKQSTLRHHNSRRSETPTSKSPPVLLLRSASPRSSHQISRTSKPFQTMVAVGVREVICAYCFLSGI